MAGVHAGVRDLAVRYVKGYDLRPVSSKQFAASRERGAQAQRAASASGTDDAFETGQERREVLGDDGPEDITVDGVVAMNQPVASTDD